ncbi:MAG: OmpP1/FadL family transporter [Granulosicoccus sp.]
MDSVARQRLVWGVMAGLTCGSGIQTTANAAGFALIEHGASGLGTAYAGAAAISNDSSTIWFNPAGMSELEDREMAFALHALNTDSTWTDRGTTLGVASGGARTSGPVTAEPGGTTALPNFYYAAPISSRWSYGLGIGIPFGSSTEYDRNWKGRYSTVESSLAVIDINPSVSYRVSDKVRLGFGVSFQQLDVEFGNALDSGSVCFAAAVDASFSTDECGSAGLVPGNSAEDSYLELTGDSTGFGFNLGALFLPSPDLKIGVAYRHSIEHDVEGDANYILNESLQTFLEGNSASAQSQLFTDNRLANGAISAEVELPATFSLSGAWQYDEKLQLLSDVTWTGWSSVPELRISFENPVQNDAVSTFDWQDVFRYSVGLTYQFNNQLLLRTGLAFDEEAIPNAQLRTPRIPGNDRTWFALGANYQVSSQLSFDIGYTRLTVDETPVDNAAPSPDVEGQGQIVRGVYDTAINILSAQVNWAFN